MNVFYLRWVLISKFKFLMYSIFRKCSIFFKTGVLNNFANFTGKHLCCSLFFNKVAGLLRTPFLQNISDGCFCILKLSCKQKLIMCIQKSLESCYFLSFPKLKNVYTKENFYQKYYPKTYEMTNRLS